MLSLRREALSAMKRGSYATRTPITTYIAGWRDATTISAPHASTAVSEAPPQYTTALHALPAAHANWRCWATLYCMPDYSCAETAASAIMMTVPARGALSRTSNHERNQRRRYVPV